MKRIVLLLFSILFCLVILLVLEGVTRVLLPEINFQDSDRALLRPLAYGDSYGWEPNATGICFGKQVAIDEYGFRRLTAPQNYGSSWLVLGDSVAFGVGIGAEDTFIQLLQNNLPHTRVWNTSVIGYEELSGYAQPLHGRDRNPPASSESVALYLSQRYRPAKHL